MPETRVFTVENYGMVKLSLGDLITFNAAARKFLGALPGWKAEIACWNHGHSDVVGLRAYEPEDYISGWGDLDGVVDDEQGYWIRIKDLVEITNSLTHLAVKYTIRHDIDFKGIKLAGRECEFLSHIDQTKLVFVDLGEDIGGCSADGLGPRGHCIAIPFKALEPVKDKKFKLKS